MGMVEGRDNFGEDPKFFIGVEVEKTPLFGKETLFVVGKQNPKEILQRCLDNEIDHAYLGCANSFQPGDSNEEWAEWDHIILELMKADIWVTLDFDSGYANHEWFHDNGWNEYDKFIPMIAVRLPYIKQFNYNATIKLDDSSFKGTNSGVWCHNVHDLMDRRNYTDWAEYIGDKVID
jgi:hypothetical protein|tara:strand:+ start:3262 stop:3792 length:531 start_codon:yes stop_codon:yes gene_type:complete